MAPYVIGVDVGTGSARAGVFDPTGRCLGRADHPIVMHRPRPEHAEYDSEDLWQAVCRAVRAAVDKSGIAPGEVVAISFDATCSLVVLGRDGRRLGVSTSPDEGWNCIVWLDHRAVAEAEECTATGHRVLDHVGGVMSPEMEIPKLMWLKRHKARSWAEAGHFFDLADYLTWRASGSVERSACTLACKWTFLTHERPGWQQDFLQAVGLEDLLAKGGLPQRAQPIGTDLGPLLPDAARDLGLPTGCRVGQGLIDAHAGALGMLGGVPHHTFDGQCALIAGTSSCLMALSPEPRAIRGVWGPFFGAVLPGLWLNEGGQTATGAVLDHVLRLHAAGGEPDGALHERVVARIGELRSEEGDDFAAGLRVLPDFHGNRSPLADPRATAVVSGLTLDSSFDALCRLYYRTAVGIVLGTRHIIDALNERGYRIDTLYLTGGHVKNPLLVELYADATGCRLMMPETDDAVLLGTAMVAAAAAGLHGGLPEAARAMAPPMKERLPTPERKARLSQDYRAFLLMHEQRRQLADMA